MPATSKQRSARTKAPDAKGSTDGGNRRKTHIVTARSRLVPSLAGPPRLLVTEMIAQND